MAEMMGVACHPYDCGEVARPDVAAIEQDPADGPGDHHIAMVHSETTTGMLNPIEEVAVLAQRYGKRCIVDVMSSFGIPMDIAALNIDYLISPPTNAFRAYRVSPCDCPRKRTANL